jgi:type II secretory pathway component PulF
MPSFQYRARDRQGALVTGSLEADNRASLEAALDKMGLIPIKVSSAKKALFKGLDLKALFAKVPQNEIILFSRQLATLFGAGVPLTRALFTLESQATHSAFMQVIRSVREEVEGGATFASALSKHPEVFPEIYTNMVEAGEAGGILDNVLDRLATMFERNADNASKVKSATLYPKIVFGAIVVAVIVLMNFVIPKFSKLYASFDVELPLPTRVLIFISDAFLAYWYMAVLLAVAAYIAIKLFISSESGRRIKDRLILRVPVFGPMILKSVLSRFARVLSSMYRSGLPILQSLDIVSRAVENRAVADEIKMIEEEVRAGRNLSEPMTGSRYFQAMVVQMVSVGEETGNLDEMLEKVAEYYDREVEATIRNLTTTLEPILLSFIFGFVLFLALAIFLPMWDILKIVRR